jgi:hypothetical protein
MGYTHYWTIKEPLSADAFGKLQEGIKTIIETANEAGISISDESTDGTIAFNGAGRDAHETFVIQVGDNEFNFCKTAEKPYDAVVTASLILLKKELGDNVEISSDGRWIDWESGQLLYETVFDIQPESVLRER